MPRLCLSCDRVGILTRQKEGLHSGPLSVRLELTFGRAAINRWVSGSVLPTCLPLAPRDQHLFFSNTSTLRRILFGRDQALVRLLHYSKAKGGRHENQIEREGWTARPVGGTGRWKRDHKNSKRKEDAMKTKSNVKAGTMRL